MSAPAVTAQSTKNGWADKRRCGLRRFSIGITVLTLLGHFVLGFEPSWAQPLVGIAATCGMELLLESIGAIVSRRRPRYWGSVGTFVEFHLSAYIAGLAIAMLLYPNQNLWPIAFAGVAAIGSKSIIRFKVNGGGTRHVLNPSNFGIALTLILYPRVGIAPAYHFTENISGVWDWLLPAVFIAWGTFLNASATGRLPVAAAWIGGFGLQAIVRALINGTPIAAGLMPMSGVAFLLFSFYMVTDPATTPPDKRSQIFFGMSVAAAYALLMTAHIVFGLFFALTLVCALRGLCMALSAILQARSERDAKCERAAAPGALPEANS